MNKKFVTLAILGAILLTGTYLVWTGRFGIDISRFFAAEPAPLCDVQTACDATIMENGVRKWCRNMNGGGYRWVVQQTCETACADSTTCQNNPIGITAECADIQLVCRDKQWVAPRCGDRLCSPELGEHEGTCPADCPGVRDTVIDTTNYWPLQEGNYWKYRGTDTATSGTFMTVMFTEPQEMECGNAMYPIRFYKDKINGYWGFGNPWNLRWYVRDYHLGPQGSGEYVSAPISKIYSRNAQVPSDVSNYIWQANFAEQQGEVLPAYHLFPRQLRINKTAFVRQNAFFSSTTEFERTDCEWYGDADSEERGQLWKQQFALEQIETPSYTGEALRVRFDEDGHDGRDIATEDWWFAKDVGVVKITRYTDWRDPEGSKVYTLELIEHGNAASPPPLSGSIRECNALTACDATIMEDEVRKWCRNMNGQGFEWVIRQACEDTCGTQASCQENPTGTVAQCADSRFVCRNGQWDTLVTSAITLPSRLPGDVDADGDVDIFDYNLLVSNFGGTSGTGDADADGDVDIFDYNLVISNFGR